MTDLTTHPLKLYYDIGLRVTVNTDNRLITDTTVSKELWLCHAKLGMSFSDIKSIIMAGFKSSFLPFHERQAYLRRVGQELNRFGEDGICRGESGDPAMLPPRTSSQLPRSDGQPRAAVQE